MTLPPSLSFRFYGRGACSGEQQGRQMSVEAIVQAAAVGQVKDWSVLKKEWAPLLAPNATVAALK